MKKRLYSYMSNMQAATENHILSHKMITQGNGEDFLVSKWFIPKNIRKFLMALYQFARFTDDIADNPQFTDNQKITQLEQINQLIKEGNICDMPEYIMPYYNLIKEHNLPIHHGENLTSAFMQDVTINRYKSWDDLMEYCNRSAAPIGRALIFLLNEKEADIEASDNLCRLWQMVNHLQGIKEDYQLLNRVYLPEKWFDNLEDLNNNFSTYSVRKAINNSLDKMEVLLKNSKSLPPTIRSTSFKIIVLYNINCAALLMRKIRKTDPMKQTIKTNTGDKILIAGKVLWELWRYRKQE